MNLRYENLRSVVTRRGVETVVLDLGHGQIDHARITVLTGPDLGAAHAFLKIIAGAATATEGRLTYGALGEDGRWRYHPEVPHERLVFVRQKRGLLHTPLSLLSRQMRRERDYLALLNEALGASAGCDLLLLDEPDESVSDMTLAAVDDVLLSANHANELTVVLITNNPARIARLNAEVLSFENGSLGRQEQD
jgi:ABC-type sulfate/molybdate transport systems ATPase subunit